MDEQLTIENIKNGAVLELANAEIQKILNNVVDPNADPAAQRTMTITVKFKPNKERNVMGIVAQAKSTLAPDIAVETMASVGKEGKKGYAAEIKTPAEPDLPNNITPMEKRS